MEITAYCGVDTATGKIREVISSSSVFSGYHECDWLSAGRQIEEIQIYGRIDKAVRSEIEKINEELNRQEDGRYYLREDFNPEPISSMIEHHKATKRFIKEMEQAGNIFNSREEAMKASSVIKQLLSKDSRMCP